jgi:Tol biopolymer transport system component
VYYVSDRGFRAITRDGTARRGLARVLHPDVLPPIVFSPDGRRIVFAYEPREPIEVMGDVCVVNTDGSGWRNLTDRLDWDTDPGWSPDGSEIV